MNIQEELSDIKLRLERIIESLSMEEKAKEVPPLLGESPLDVLGLSHHTLRVLQGNKRRIDDKEITKVGDLLDQNCEDLLRFKNFGMKALMEVRIRLGEHGIALKGESVYNKFENDRAKDASIVADRLAGKTLDELSRKYGTYLTDKKIKNIEKRLSEH